MALRARNTWRCENRQRRRTSGFTLVEVIIAVVLIDIGLLSFVAGSAVLIRRTNDVRAEAAALQAANGRVEMLGVGPCAVSSGTATISPSLREAWWAEVPLPGLRELRDSVTYEVQGRTRSLVVRTRRPC
jgi:prepilin-type N-terminal cleavage/methylation domain-containing protein